MAENEAAVADAPVVETSNAPAPIDLSQGGWGDETYVLKHPFVFAGATVREVKLRIPTGRDLEFYYASPARTLRMMLDRLADVDEKQLDAMHGSDYARLMGIVGEFAAGVR